MLGVYYYHKEKRWASTFLVSTFFKSTNSMSMINQGHYFTLKVFCYNWPFSTIDQLYLKKKVSNVNYNKPKLIIALRQLIFNILLLHLKQKSLNGTMNPYESQVLHYPCAISRGLIYCSYLFTWQELCAFTLLCPFQYLCSCC